MFDQARMFYEVNPDTVALLAREENGEKLTEVLEDGERFLVRQPPARIIDRSCRFFGSSLKGRQEGIKEICGITHKAPVSIDPANGMYFFPTASPTHPDCSWISHSHIDQVNKVPVQCTEIIFKDGTSVTLEVSYGSIMNQIQRTAQYRYLLDHRIKYIPRNHADLVAEPHPFVHIK